MKNQNILNNAKTTAKENNSRPFMVTDAQGHFISSFGDLRVAKRNQANNSTWLLFEVNENGDVTKM